MEPFQAVYLSMLERGSDTPSLVLLGDSRVVSEPKAASALASHSA